MCMLKSFGSGQNLSLADVGDDYRMIGYTAYRVNNACLPGTPLWCARLTRESLSSIADRFMNIYEASPESAEMVESPVTVVHEDMSDIVTGSEKRMWRYLRSKREAKLDHYTLLPIRFGEILIGLYLGGAYSMDEEAYNRFYPLARKHGYGAEPQIFTGCSDDGMSVIRVEFGD